jgi:hypothetical protein
LMVLAPEVLLDFDHSIIHFLLHFFFALMAVLFSRSLPIRLLVRERHKMLVRERLAALALVIFSL